MPAPITWGAWCMIGGIALLLALLGFVIWRKARRSSTETAEDTNEKARADALASLATCPTEDRTETATECSIIVRRYLSRRTGDPALYQTHEEWVSRHDSLEDFSDGIKQQLDELFSQLARSKYAPSDQGDEPGVMIENSRQVIDAVHRGAGR